MTCAVHRCAAEFERCQAVRLKRLTQRCYNSGYRQFERYQLVNDSTLRALSVGVIVDTRHRVLMHAVPKSGHTAHIQQLGVSSLDRKKIIASIASADKACNTTSV